MFTIGKGIGGVVRWRAPRRPDALPTVEIRNAGGGPEVAAGSATTALEAATTLTGAHAAKVSVLTVASTAGWAVGDEVAVGTAYRSGDFVKIATIPSATQITTQFPTLYAYDAGVAVGRTYISYTLLAATASRIEQGWTARFSWKFGTVDQQVGVVRFDVVDYGIAHMPATMSDVRLLEPKITERLSTDFDYERGFGQALNEVVRELNETDSALGLLTDDDWRDLVALKFVVLSTRLWGPEYVDVREMWDDQYGIRFRRWKSQFHIDKDGDGVAESTERSGWGARLRRGS